MTCVALTAIVCLTAAVVPTPTPAPWQIAPNPDLTVDRAADLERAYNTCNGVLTIPAGVYPVSRTVDFTKREANVHAEQVTIQAMRNTTSPLLVYGAPLGKRNLSWLRWTGGHFIGGGGFVLQNVSYSVVDIAGIRCASPAFTLSGDTAVGSYCTISLHAVGNNSGAIRLNLIGPDAWSGLVTFRDTYVIANGGNVPLIQEVNKTTGHGTGDWFFDRCGFEGGAPGNDTYTLLDNHNGQVAFRDCHLETGLWPKPCSLGNIGTSAITFINCSDNTGITGNPNVRVIR
jgi:hypothetical protein